MATNDQILSEIACLRKDIDSLAKIVRKVKSHLDDPNGEKAAARRNNPNNGFNRPRIVSDALKQFLGMAPDDTISRTNVTRGVYAYIKEHNLKDPNNGKIIVPDEKLKSLLGVDADTPVTFTNIQKFISPHYVKDEPKPAEPVQEEPTTPKPVATPIVKKKIVKTVKKAVVRKPVVSA